METLKTTNMSSNNLEQYNIIIFYRVTQPGADTGVTASTETDCTSDYLVVSLFIFYFHSYIFLLVKLVSK